MLGTMWRNSGNIFNSFIIQFGPILHATSTGWNNGEITFPIAYTEFNVVVYGHYTISSTQNVAYNEIGLYGKTLTSFKYRQYSTYSGYDWISIGY